MLSRHSISILDQSLELVVLCERDDLQHSPELGENLEKKSSGIIVVMNSVTATTTAILISVVQAVLESTVEKCVR